jgi:type I restriction enzyme, S subunit
MKLATFFKNFDRLADAPDAMAQFRKLLLRLAVQGKLVCQDPRDEPAAVAVLRVPKQPAPARLSKRSTARIQGIAALSVGPTEFDIPDGWACVPLIQIARIESGHTPSRTRADWWGGDVSWVGVVDARLHDGKTIVETRQHTNEAGLANSAARILPTGTVCVSRTASVGYVIILGKPMATSQDFVNWVPSKAVTSDWLRLVLSAEKDAFHRFSKGAVHQTIYYPEWLAMHTLLPPLAEQKRIVAKVDELMALCDRLETQQQERETRHTALARASLARFAAAPTPANLNFLFHKSYTIDPAELRKSILTLAVQGKLVPQDPKDESASSALARLDARGGNSKIRRSVPLDVRKPDTVDEENLPKSWTIESTARLLHLGAIVDLKDGNHGANHPKVAEFTKKGLPFITAAQVSDDGTIDYDGAYKVSGEALKRLRVGFAKPNDVIYTHKGSVGRVAICNQECVLTPQTTYYRLNPDAFTSGYVRTFLLSPLYRKQVDLVKRQTTRDFVSINAQYQFFLRVPPLAEQRRIVAKVDQLMALVDQLETQLAASRATAQNLLDAIVAELTAAGSPPPSSPTKKPAPRPSAAAV